MSFDVSFSRSPICLPLFRIDLCESIAAFGIDVVPLVNCILHTSSGSSSISKVPFPSPDAATSSNLVNLPKLLRSTLPWELSTVMTRRKLVITEWSRLRSGKKCLRSGMFERGGFRGKLLSREIMR